MKLIVQLDEGIEPVLKAIRSAKKRIDIAIFRCSLKALERELAAAVERGVLVSALVAHTHGGSDQPLRELELRLLAAGVTVARTQDDLVRYHSKVLLVDRETLFVLGFNFTANDVKSRSFGIGTRNRRTLRDVIALFDADRARAKCTPTAPDLVVSPQNARRRLMRFVKKARVSLDIYDANVTDDQIIRTMKERAEQGVRIRILGKLEKKWQGDHFDARPFPGRRLHVRAIIRDGRRAFVGSQSLRKLELDERREVGLIVRDITIVKRIQQVFDSDWHETK